MCGANVTGEDLSSSRTTDSTCKASLHWRTAVRPQRGLFTFLSHPQDHCNACSSTSLQPQNLALMNCQACFFKAGTQILRSLTKTNSENSGVGGYLTGEGNYNWHLNTRATAGNPTLTTVHELQVTVIVLKSFSPNGNRQVGEALTEPRWLIYNHFENLTNTNHMAAVFGFPMLLSWWRERWSCFGP